MLSFLCVPYCLLIYTHTAAIFYLSTDDSIDDDDGYHRNTAKSTGFYVLYFSIINLEARITYPLPK